MSLNQLPAEFSFCTPSAPPSTYTFKQIRRQDCSCQLCSSRADSSPPTSHLTRVRCESPGLSAPESYLTQTGPASVLNVLLSENQPFTAIEGAP